MSTTQRCLILLCVVFALVGQSASYAEMACELHEGHSPVESVPYTDVAMNHNDMSHEIHHATPTETAEMAGMDCCDNDCSCPDSACMSHTFILTYYSTMHNIASSEAIMLPFSSELKARSNSLFRPPIQA